MKIISYVKLQIENRNLKEKIDFLEEDNEILIANLQKKDREIKNLKDKKREVFNKWHENIKKLRNATKENKELKEKYEKESEVDSYL